VFATHAADLTRPEDHVNQSPYFEARTFLHGLLLQEDASSMAHSLEARGPLRDDDLVECVIRTPVGFERSGCNQMLDGLQEVGVHG